MDDVALTCPEFWSKVSAEVQQRILVGLDRLRAVRDAISADARVRRMPFVEVQPAAWQTESGRRRQACAGIWRVEHGAFRIGVITAVGVTICEDVEVVRCLLVHEFSHCFKLATKIQDHLDLRTSLSFDGDPEDPAFEAAMHADSADWFGDLDRELMPWRDPRLDFLDEELSRLVTAGHLPVAPPPGEQSIPRAHVAIIVPAEWTLHVRALRKR